MEAVFGRWLKEIGVTWTTRSKAGELVWMELRAHLVSSGSNRITAEFVFNKVFAFGHVCRLEWSLHLVQQTWRWHKLSKNYTGHACGPDEESGLVSNQVSLSSLVTAADASWRSDFGAWSNWNPIWIVCYMRSVILLAQQSGIEPLLTSGRILAWLCWFVL